MALAAIIEVCWAPTSFCSIRSVLTMDCPATVKAVRELSQKWPPTYAKVIEDKANGSAIIQMLQHEIAGILPVNPEGGKVARRGGQPAHRGWQRLPYRTRTMRLGLTTSSRSARPSPTARTMIRSTP